MKEEFVELIRDRFAQRSNAAYISLPIIFSVLSSLQDNTHLFKLGIFLFLLTFISLNSIYILIAQRSRPGVYSDNKGNKTEILVERYPKLHTLAKGGVAVSVIMLISGFFIPSFRNLASPTNTATPVILSETSTLAPTAAPTYTLTPTNQPPLASTATVTPTIDPQSVHPNYFITDCIEYGVWNIWGINDIPTPQPDEQNKRCYDLSRKSLTAQKKRLNSPVEGLRININSTQTTMSGIYFPLEKVLDLKLSLEIEQLTSENKCKDDQVCDVNLIMGFGDPYDGWLLVYRSVTEESLIYTCLFITIDTTCVGEKQIARARGDEPLVQDLQFTRNGQDLEITIDGKIVGNKSIFGMDERFWIGYQIRRNGTIKAFIEFK